MGQRHQLFVIARIHGRYRCVAAFHSQWLYGGQTITAAARLLRAFENPFNARNIAAEILTLEHNRGLEGAAEAPCPYLTSIVLNVFRVDFDEGVTKTMYILPYGILPSNCDNNDGYTVFDLTPNEVPRYCFFYDLPDGIPLGPAQYMSYYDGGFKGIEADVEYLSKFASVPQGVLSVTWPADFPNTPSATDTPAESSSKSQSEGPPSLATLSLKAALRDLLASDGPTAHDVLDPILTSVAQNLEAVKHELLQGTSLNSNGLAVLKVLLASSADVAVDLSPWLRTGVLTPEQLESLSEALVNATTLNVTNSPTLTIDVLQSVINKMPNLQHVIAFDCPALEMPTVPLALSSYLETKDLTASLAYSSVFSNGTHYTDCVRYVDPASPPAGLTVLIYTRSLSMIPRPTDKEIQYGVELSAFSATGVAHGFESLLRLLFFDQLSMFLGFSGLEFPMRAAFQKLDNNGALGTLPPLVGNPPPMLQSEWGPFAIPLPGSQSTRTSPAPRYPGWTLVLDTRAGVPIIPGWRETRPLLDVIREKKGNEMLYRPFYGFVRWDYDEDGATLVPRQVCDLREWAAQLPRGRGRLEEEAALELEKTLAEQKATLISLADAANSGNWPDELWKPLMT
ncbi:hypothetical protein EXIGLDRAFT_753008 [Exidia glandulosa HHB12029]|uniref:Uncharacterized protein n=1 Tax=Exidia glandulosa HHB12029 TaxID=1314781 RepID=A0A165E459_EXIGL|nr:hypothetical protein EXIGLDRAFT_753008 [Exidia glandulosa HHB12029]